MPLSHRSSCVVLSLWALSAFATERPRVVVFGIEASEPALTNLAATATQQLETELSRSGELLVLGQRDLVTALGLERQRQLLGCSEEGCAAEIGSALNAAWLVGGTLGGAGVRLRLDLKVVRLRDAVAVWRDGKTFVDPGDLFPLITTLGEAARQAVLPAPVQKPAASRSAGPWVLMGAGVAVGAGGAVALGLAYDEFARVQRGVTLGTLSAQEGQRRTTAINGAIVGGVVAASVGGAALISGLIWKLAEPPVTPTAMVTPEGFHLAVGGSF